LIVDGYGLPAPESGIVIAPAFVKDFVPTNNELTVSANPVLALKAPSLTVTVIVAVPVCPAAGVSVTVRLLPLPSNTIPLCGTSVGLDELPLNVRLPTGESASATVNGIAAVTVSTVADWFGIALIVGGCGPIVVTVILQPPAMFPEDPELSSTTYRDHAPLAD